MNQLEALAVKRECHDHKLSPCRDPQEVKGVLLRERETSEQLAPGKMTSKRPIVAGRSTKEETSLWVIPGRMNNEKK